MNGKLVISDIDGTFLNHDRGIPADNLAAVDELQRQGHSFAIATGRIYATARMIAHQMGKEMYIISNNGASIRHTAVSKPLYEEEVCRGLSERVFSLAEEHGYEYQVYTDFSMVAKAPNPFLERYVREMEGLPERLRYTVDMQGDPRSVGGIRKIALMFFRKSLTKELLRDLTGISELYAVQSHRFGIDLCLRGVHKGSGLRRLAGHLGVDVRDTIAFGDEDNDETLLRAAGTGIAMGNATALAKRAARHITVTNDEAGVAYALREILNLIT